MGYKIKVQKVERPSNRSYYVNLPSPIAEAVKMQKGEVLEWFIENRNVFILKRVNPIKSFLKKGGYNRLA